jgi:hypothetical protein
MQIAVWGKIHKTREHNQVHHSEDRKTQSGRKLRRPRCATLQFNLQLAKHNPAGKSADRVAQFGTSLSYEKLQNIDLNAHSQFSRDVRF